MNCAENIEFNFAPFAVHRAIMKNLEPQMHYHGGDVISWQQEFRAKLREILGLDNMPLECCPLNIRSFWKQETTLGTIEKIGFTSEPNHDIAAYVCLPHRTQKPMPFFICLQGHSTGMHVSVALDPQNEEKSIVVEGDRDFCIECMRRGIPSIAIEQRGFGMCEDAYKAVPRCQNPAVHAMMLGRTLLGERIFDVNRVIDYLEARGDVDMKRIGVMGNSGGGTVSMFAGGLLNRLSWVMPSCSFSSFKASLMSIEHCICNYVPQMLLWGEMSDVAALAAPKPLVLVNGLKDNIFPIKEAQEEFIRVKEIYRQFDAEEHCHHIIGADEHRFYAADAWPVMLREMN